MEKTQLQVLREARNHSRKDIAQILGSNIKHIVNLEKGSEMLSKEERDLLQKHFDLSEDYFDPIEEDTDIFEDYDYNDVIGCNIKYFREKNGMTQQILAEEVGFSMGSSLSAIERGIKPIGKKKLIKLAEIFNIHISDLFSSVLLSDTDNNAKLINDFNFLVKSEKQPSVMSAIKSLIETGCKEIRGH